MSLSMRLVPNPGDGLVQVLADTFGIGTGLMKNCVDAFCIVLSLIMGLLFAGKPVGIGIGTVCAVMLVGRVIALFHHILERRCCRRLDWKVAGTDRVCGKRCTKDKSSRFLSKIQIHKIIGDK